MKIQIKDRSDEELNRTIAEWMGWKFVPERDVSFTTPAGHAMPEGWTDPQGEPYSIPPNYCRDLNACHEAEKQGLGSSTAWVEFTLALINVLQADNMSEVDGITCTLQATARQRAEALVRVIEQQKGQQR